ncbi:hypothetical protein K435DRAFT_801741 [Dendrothele bispora CBS 962.96]|uniref:Uncharacterized protein n=1 Tax=Dendrothele bispora (strain CBS 962.96) TaxID=1314807 RepID=A0A4S8LNR4_DENBC|nr:hypothetical protein K435DRAFT_801741 [Dendrothele bispora CBS 962.96]
MIRRLIYTSRHRDSEKFTTCVQQDSEPALRIRHTAKVVIKKGKILLVGFCFSVRNRAVACGTKVLMIGFECPLSFHFVILFEIVGSPPEFLISIDVAKWQMGSALMNSSTDSDSVDERVEEVIVTYCKFQATLCKSNSFQICELILIKLQKEMSL